MVFSTEFSGPRSAVDATPARAPGSVRRTTTIDVSRGGDLYGPATIDARGRDLSTDREGRAKVIADAHLVSEVAGERSLSRLEALAGSGAPDPVALAGLLGAPVAGGFRSRVEAAIGDHRLAGTLWHLLIDDLVGAVLVSGVAPQHVEALAGGGPIVEMTREFEGVMFATMSDLCAGWATEATMLTEYRRNAVLPVALGPAAPVLERADDPWSWHQHAPLPFDSVRRRRRIDLGPTDDGGSAAFDVHFRDSHVDGEGTERSVHEYTVAGRYDEATGRIVEIESKARVLPWRECPGAVGSEARVIGVAVEDLRRHVQTDLRGTSTCTHLNDTLRSLADLGVLAAARSTI